MHYTPGTPIRILKSTLFECWFSALKDLQARSRIEARIRRLSVGNAGDVRPVGAGVSEMRIDYGPGYRVYFKRQGALLVLLLCGGDKRSQAADIRKAIQIAAEWQE
jgi:putative addiction module killer protein